MNISFVVHAFQLRLLDPNRQVLPEAWEELGLAAEKDFPWDKIAAITQKLTKAWGAMRPADAPLDQVAFCDQMQFEWLLRFCYLQVSPGCASCSRAEVLAALPDLEVFAGRLGTSNGFSVFHTLSSCSSYLAGALFCESIGEDQLCMAWVSKQLETPNGQGGDMKPSSKAMALLIRARAMARRGLPGDAAKATKHFGEAADVGRQTGMPYFVAQALSQQQTFVAAPHGGGGDGELHAAVAALHSSPEVLAVTLAVEEVQVKLR